MQTFAQNCDCDRKPELREIISCEKTVFKNGAKIYWNYNCDSSTIIFENKNIKKKIYTLEKDFQDFTGRLGFITWTETNNHFIIKNKTTSGCCNPLEIYLFDKNNGVEERKLGNLIFESDRKNDFIVTLLDLNTVLIYMLETDKNIKINLPKGRFQKTLERSAGLHAEEYFEDIKFEDEILSINYRYLDDLNKWETDKIKVNFKIKNYD